MNKKRWKYVSREDRGPPIFRAVSPLAPASSFGRGQRWLGRSPRRCECTPQGMVVAVGGGSVARAGGGVETGRRRGGEERKERTSLRRDRGLL